jgi:RNase P subunit RPR2
MKPDSATDAKTCKKCDQPMAPKGTRRRRLRSDTPGEYQHARGCPLASKRERAATERLWALVAAIDEAT